MDIILIIVSNAMITLLWRSTCKTKIVVGRKFECKQKRSIAYPFNSVTGVDVERDMHMCILRKSTKSLFFHNFGCKLCQSDSNSSMVFKWQQYIIQATWSRSFISTISCCSNNTGKITHLTFSSQTFLLFPDSQKLLVWYVDHIA